MKPFFKRQKMRYFMSIVNTERLRIMNLHQGQRAVTLCCLLAAGTAAAETVTVEAVTDVRPGETQEQIVARMTPQLQDMALKQQRGTIARVTSFKGDKQTQELQLVQAGIVGSKVVAAYAVGTDQMRVAMAFDLDNKTGQEFGKLTAENATMKAHLGELADAANTNPVSNTALSDAAAAKYAALQAMAGNTATIRSGLATTELGSKLALAAGPECHKRYDVSQVSDIKIEPGLQETVSVSATVKIVGLVDDCEVKSFNLGAWVGKTRTMSSVNFRKTSHMAPTMSDTNRLMPREFGLTGVTIYDIPFCNQDNDSVRCLKTDTTARSSELSWSHRISQIEADGSGVTLTYRIDGIPNSQLADNDEVVFKVIPNT